MMRQTRLFTSTKVRTQPGAYSAPEAYTIDVVSLRIVREKSVPYATKQLNSPDKVAELLNCILDFKSFDREALVVIPIDAKLKPLGINIAHVGSLTESTTHPREIFKYAILTNAYGIFIAHNHPAGDPEPSREDCIFTRKIKEAGELLGIKLIDHVIVAGETYFSFRENGDI
jgi:DNA repair protein RadC